MLRGRAPRRPSRPAGGGSVGHSSPASALLVSSLVAVSRAEAALGAARIEAARAGGEGAACAAQGEQRESRGGHGSQVGMLG